MKRLLVFAILMVLSFGPASVFAKTLKLYSEPNSGSKAAGMVNTETGVTIVYTPKSGEWIKVANPTNGDVGWVKSSDLGGNHYNMRVISTGDDGAHSYNLYQFGGNTGLYSQEQMEKQMQQLEKQQRMMQMHMNHLFNDIFYFPQPVFVPVVMVPVQEQKSSQSSVTNKK